MREEDAPPALREAWQRALADWDNAALHDEVIKLVSAHGLYAWGAARYREAHNAGKPGEKHLERITRAAMVTLSVSATQKPETPNQPYKATIGVLGFLLVVIVAGLFYALVFHEPSHPKGAPPTQLSP